MPNLRDVAVRASVSIATVSHVFNETRPVLQVTRDRVLNAAQELDYKPNMIARSLRRKHTQTIGLMVADIDTPYFTELVHAVEATTDARGYSVILCNSGDNVEREARQIDTLLAKQVDGLILIPAAGDHAYLENLLKRGTRIVLANRFLPEIGCPAVIADDEQSAYELTSLLLRRGHRSIGAASWVEGVSTYEARWRGVTRALEEIGGAADLVWRYRGSANPSDGRRAAQELALLPDSPTAVVCFNSLIRDGILLELFSIAPELLTGIEITGFGYSALAHFAGSSRYYIEQPSREIGCVATEYLLDVLSGEADWRPSDRILVGTRLAEFEFAEPGGSVVATRLETTVA